MPPKGKGGGGGGGVGRALMRRHKQAQQGGGGAGGGHGGQKALAEKTKLVSVLESNSLDDFLSTALMAQRDFTATKERDMILLDPRGTSTTLSASKQRKLKARIESLKVPRRPAWRAGMSAAELDRLEKDTFLDWRRHIAELEEANEGTAKVTPFEKNLEVWRQLWRVLERSRIIIQIVDARNPLFYYSEDLHVYAAQEQQPARLCLVLINKADFLTLEQRRAWAKHFRSRGWACAFFSARQEQAKLTEQARVQRDEAIRAENSAAAGEEEEEEESEDEDDEDDEEEEDEEVEDEGGVAGEAEPAAQKEGQSAATDEAPGEEEDEEEDGRILTRDELLAQLRRRGQGMESERDGNRITVGMVGFPNVGKSSVINVLLGVTPLDHEKGRVAISSTPGKTKHFQTLVLDDHLMLCDCPGLVFPSFVATTAQMVCAGVLPINQLRDHMAPVNEVCRRLPSAILRAYYGLPAAALEAVVEGHETAEAFLIALCEARGYTSQGSGVPDVNRAARMVLKDYVEGRLFFNHPPPGLGEEDDTRYYEMTIETLSHAPKLAGRATAGVGLETHTIEEEDEEHGEEDSGDEEDVDGMSAVEVSVGGLSMGASSGGGSRGRIRPAKKWGKKGKKLRNKTPYADDVEEEGGQRWAAARAKGAWGDKESFTRVRMPHWEGRVADDGTRQRQKP